MPSTLQVFGAAAACSHRSFCATSAFKNVDTARKVDSARRMILRLRFAFFRAFFSSAVRAASFETGALVLVLALAFVFVVDVDDDDAVAVAETV